MSTILRNTIKNMQVKPNHQYFITIYIHIMLQSSMIGTLIIMVTSEVIHMIMNMITRCTHLSTSTLLMIAITNMMILTLSIYPLR